MNEPASPPAASARDKIARLRARFLEQLPGRLDEAEALLARLHAAPADHRAQADLHRFFHSLKGTGRSFGFGELGVIAGRAEALMGRFGEQPDSPPPQGWHTTLRETLQQLRQMSSGAPAAGDEAGAGLPGFALPPTPAEAHGEHVSPLVYLCDDEVAQVEQLAIQLNCFGYQTVLFGDPADLRAAVLARRPGAVVMDINFPDQQSGADVLQAMQAQSEQPIPAIFLSGRDDFEARLRAVQAGGEAYFIKPARAMDLVAALDELTRQQQPEPYRILVVDDEAEIAGYHRILLEEAGMITHHLQDPEQLLPTLQEFRPDMVLMDMYMPTCTGHELAKLIRQVPDHVGLPIVYLSSETDKHKQYSAMRVGAEGFMTKPVVPEELVTAVAIRAERMRTLRSLMARDSLTGLFNHTTTTQLLDNAIAISRRNGSPLSFAMIDIDHFKSVNDSYGHPVGDQVILALARVLQQRLRNSDIVGRYGGEEFAVILPDVEVAEARKIIDELRRSFARVQFHAGQRGFSCSFSSGVADTRQFKRMESLREAADQALYQAKRGGRNQVVAAGDPP